MTWYLVDDKLWGHPKATGAGLPAMGLWVMAGSWSASYLTEGHVPAGFVKGQAAHRAATQLVEVGLWIPTDDGWQFHDWLENQRSRAQVLAKREAERKKKQRQRE